MEKLKIINNTNLNYNEIGYIIDKYLEYNEPHEEGKIEYLDFGNPTKGLFTMQIRHLKKYKEYRFEKVAENFVGKSAE